MLRSVLFRKWERVDEAFDVCERVLLKPRVGAVYLMGMMRREGVARKKFQTGM
jgi:hypothetical protein